MAITNSDVTVTSTWTKISTNDSGDFILYNEAQPSDDRTPEVGSTASEAIRYAFGATTPTARGCILFPGCSMARGSVVGHVWVKCDSPSAENILAQKAE